MNRWLQHGTCVAINGQGVLLLGESGSGKSDIALRLIDTGAALVADDQVEICAQKGVLLAAPPEKIKGLLEIRGVGILSLPYSEPVALALAVRLVGRGQVERMPQAQFFDCLGVQLPLHCLHAFDSSTPAKIRAAYPSRVRVE